MYEYEFRDINNNEAMFFYAHSYDELAKGYPTTDFSELKYIDCWYVD